MGFMKYKPGELKHKGAASYVLITKTGCITFSKGCVIKHPELKGPGNTEVFYDKYNNSIGIEVKNGQYKTKDSVAISKSNSVRIKGFMRYFEIKLLENNRFDIIKEADRALYIINLNKPLVQGKAKVDKEIS